MHCLRIKNMACPNIRLIMVSICFYAYLRLFDLSPYNLYYVVIIFNRLLNQPRSEAYPTPMMT